MSDVKGLARQRALAAGGAVALLEYLVGIQTSVNAVRDDAMTRLDLAHATDVFEGKSDPSALWAKWIQAVVDRPPPREFNGPKASG